MEGDSLYVSRNDALVFAAHTRVNLDHILMAYSDGAEVHPVTQVINSLLGLVVFLHEEQLERCTAKIRLEELTQNGWPKFDIQIGKCKTLADLLRRLRNGIAHGRIVYSSDSKHLEHVAVQFQDCSRSGVLVFRSEINAELLRQFCLRLTELVPKEIG